MARPTSAQVAVRRTRTTPVSGSTSTSAAATQTSQKTGPSSYEPVPSGCTSARPISSPPAKPKCRRMSATYSSGSGSPPAISASWARRSSAARITARPATVVERLAPVERS